MSHDDHAHDHGHAHDAPPSPYHSSQRSEERNRELTEKVARLEDLLVAKGIVDRGALDRAVDIYENDLGPMNGARVVARAWTDPAYKQRLLDNATAAIAELGYGGLQGEHMVVCENTPEIHNVVVCTLCSCYPWPVLGLPPTWYKDYAYRSRVVVDPRGVLADFGTELPDDVEVRVWDSSAEVRYLVLPERPAGTEGMSEEQLAELVERDAMIGVTKVEPA
ncbi:nitrile hydratase subunit alpha [Altererythrobacter salegens]|uniref:nitrile hydratase n=1 Tax=Croceibacterium salegens TaxID=1737568 RepID=A0A6I4T0H2_9SPHN|nr:nitrile hydratase subunit alpha [Croceibacterium salegens]MXO60122.1 nitrile hydratase subunit alpha [Croceibacterium salegens]